MIPLQYQMFSKKLQYFYRCKILLSTCTKLTTTTTQATIDKPFLTLLLNSCLPYLVMCVLNNWFVFEVELVLFMLNQNCEISKLTLSLIL